MGKVFLGPSKARPEVSAANGSGNHEKTKLLAYFGFDRRNEGRTIRKNNDENASSFKSVVENHQKH